MALELSLDFDSGGCATSGTSLADGVLSIKPHADVDNLWGWFACRLDNALGESISVVIDPANRRTENSSNFHWLWMADELDTDGQTPVPVNWTSNSVTASLGPFTSDTVYLSHAVLYPFSRFTRKMSEWAAHSHFVSPPNIDGFVIDSTSARNQYNGREVPALPIYAALISDPTGPAARNTLVLTGGNHPGESQHRFNLEAAVDWLLSPAKMARAMRRLFYIYVLPSVNPQGLHGGYHRSSPEVPNTDHNRIWGIGSTQETAVAVESFLSSIDRVDAHIEYHGRFSSDLTEIWLNTSASANSEFTAAVDARFPITVRNVDVAGTLDRYVGSLNSSLVISAVSEESIHKSMTVADYLSNGEQFIQAVADLLLDGEFSVGYRERRLAIRRAVA